jgi:16S rRNA (guanine527-N7)-methyltransferase
MENNIQKSYIDLGLNNVSRETCVHLEKFIDLVIKENKLLNLISRENENKEYIRKRHIVDSMQIIDFIDLNTKKIIDFGSGSGFPSIVLAIILKIQSKKTKIEMFEKSYRKCKFLEKVSKELNLNTEVIQKNIFEEKDLGEIVITSRAFKPLPIILNVVEKNYKNYKNIILFMGKSGKEILTETLKNWKIDYEAKDSITSNDSFILNINNAQRI